MATYILRRTLQAIPILFGVALVSFAIIQLAPGSPIDRFRTPSVRPETLENLIRLYGLDKPVHEQFNGILAAVRQYSWADKAITTFATVGYAIPSFLLGIYIAYLGTVVFRGAFPSFGMVSLPGVEGRGTPLDVAWHMVLPVTALAIQQIAGWSRYVRAKMLEVMNQDYVRTAKAKGLSGGKVTYKHALRNALIPVVTLFGLTLPGLLAGAVITESIFSWPGLGLLGLTAVEQRDYPVVLAFVMVGGFGVVLGNLLADVLYGVVDPRIKY